MTKSFRIAALTLVSIAGAGLIAAAIFAPDITVTIPETKVAEVIETQVPMEIKKNGVDAVINEASVDFLDTNKLRISAEFTADGYGVAGDGNLVASSGLTYRGGNFYLSDIKVEEIAFDPNKESAETISDATSVTKTLFNAARDKFLVGEDGDAGPANRLTEKALKWVKVEAMTKLNTELTKIPVYSLNDKGMKMNMAKAALKDIRFTEATAEVTLSPSKVALLILGSILIGIAAIGMSLAFIGVPFLAFG